MLTARPFVPSSASSLTVRMKVGGTMSTSWQKIREFFDVSPVRAFYIKLSRRKRLLGLAMGCLLLFLLFTLLAQSGGEEVEASRDTLKVTPRPGSETLAIDLISRFPLNQGSGESGGNGGGSSSSKDLIGYRKSSDFFSSIVWGNSHAVCIGSDEARDEVEDLLCMPKPDYDPRMKNPCWWENLIQTPAPGMHAPTVSVRSLNCLPYFHILCCSKSGTTDLFRRISMHPDIVPNFGQFGKERLWWSWLKYGYRSRQDKGDPLPFYKYVKGFGILARYLEKAVTYNPKDLKRLVTVDGSPPDMWDLRGWTQLPQNRNLRQPAVITPHLMRHLYRDPKFVILTRDPVERMYTAYLFHGLGHTKQEFHRDVVRGIAIFDRCLAMAEDRIECFVNASVFRELPVDLHFSCYVVYFEEWLKVFPRKHFLFLRTEEYSVDLKGNLLKVFNFLDLPKPSSKDLKKMIDAPQSHHTRQKDLAGPMLEETRAMLKAWFKPWNQELAQLMKDKGYLWNDVESDS